LSNAFGISQMLVDALLLLLGLWLCVRGHESLRLALACATFSSAGLGAYWCLAPSDRGGLLELLASGGLSQATLLESEALWALVVGATVTYVAHSKLLFLFRLWIVASSWMLAGRMVATSSPLRFAMFGGLAVVAYAALPSAMGGYLSAVGADRLSAAWGNEHRRVHGRWSHRWSACARERRTVRERCCLERAR